MVIPAAHSSGTVIDYIPCSCPNAAPSLMVRDVKSRNPYIIRTIWQQMLISKYLNLIIVAARITDVRLKRNRTQNKINKIDNVSAAHLAYIPSRLS
jgi:hypothetical protein